MRHNPNVMFSSCRILCLSFLMVALWPGVLVSGELKGYQQTLWKHLEAVVAVGPRPPGSPALEKLRGYIRSVGKKYADEVREQKFTFQKLGGPSVAMVNIELVFHGKFKKAPLLLGAHYDTRPFADEEKDPYSRQFPIVGANDGGSGTAVLLALAQYLHAHKPGRPVRLVFFDGEDYGVKHSSDYFLGSKHYAAQLEKADRKEWPYCVLIIDMVGDRELKITKETYSAENASWLLKMIDESAEKLKAPEFRNQPKHTVRDDHLPFIKIGIPAAVLMDFDYPYWHTLQDTLDKCSPESLFAVFSVVVDAMDKI
jgi:Zn-dependent M28 family amino/carboxypeptidase